MYSQQNHYALNLVRSSWNDSPSVNLHSPTYTRPVPSSTEPALKGSRMSGCKNASRGTLTSPFVPMHAAETRSFSALSSSARPRSQYKILRRQREHVQVAIPWMRSALQDAIIVCKTIHSEVYRNDCIPQRCARSYLTKAGLQGTFSRWYIVLSLASSNTHSSQSGSCCSTHLKVRNCVWRGVGMMSLPR
jgi:hypothetical protein